MDDKMAQNEVKTEGRRLRTRAPLAECNGNMNSRDRSRSPIKFSGKTDNKELLMTPKKDPSSDVTIEDFETSPISSYKSSDNSDAEHETDSFHRKIKARFTGSGEPVDYSVPHPSDPIVLGSSFLQKNPDFSFSDVAQFTSTPKQPSPATERYYAGSHVVTITKVDKSCEFDSGLGNSTADADSPQSPQPSEAACVLEQALEGILDDEEVEVDILDEQEKQKSPDESEAEEEIENSVTEDDSSIDETDGENASMVINEQNEVAQAPAEIPLIVPRESVAPARLLDNIQWFYKRPGMKVREALADAGVCATEVLMDELRFRPGIYHQRGDSWHSKNLMSSGGVREVLVRLGADDYSTEAYKLIFRNLQRFTGTYLFLRHSLDHGNFPPELEFLQEEALKVRNSSPFFNPERAQCLRINRDFNDLVLQQAVRAARQFGALSQDRARRNDNTNNAEEADRQEDEENLSD